jgi:RNA-directed DNA polymerase
MKHPWSPQHFAREALDAGCKPEVIEAAQDAALAIKRSNEDLPVIFTLEHLGHLIDVNPETIRSFVDRRDDPYRVFRVKKRPRPGRGAAPPRASRTICVPSPALMHTQRWIAQNILNAVDPHPASFAFAPGRSLVDAASRHAGCSWLIKLDLRNFFEAISERRVYRVFRQLGYGTLISFELARICTRSLTASGIGSGALASSPPYPARRQGFLPQGAPSSPMLANLAVRRLDDRLQVLADGKRWVYTRYADDLAFSTNRLSTRQQAAAIAREAKREIRDFGVICNESKTAIIPPGAHKIMLGVLIDHFRPKLTRAFRNNIETHLYALSNPKIGAAAHLLSRGFSSVIGMRRHIAGLIAFAKQVDAPYAQKLYRTFDEIDWEA